MVELTILTPVDSKQIKNLEEALHQIQDLRVALISGSVDEGIRVTVLARKPIPLANILGEIPLVEQAAKHGKEIQISLKTKP